MPKEQNKKSQRLLRSEGSPSEAVDLNLVDKNPTDATTQQTKAAPGNRAGTKRNSVSAVERQIPHAKATIMSLCVKKRAVSDSAFISKSDEKPLYNNLGLKVEAFDTFQKMLNQCGGSHNFDVLDTAAILKQFTPDVIRKVIYVLAEGVQKDLIKEAESQTDKEGNTAVSSGNDKNVGRPDENMEQAESEPAQEHPDQEIKSIVANAQQSEKGSSSSFRKGKWQPIPELVQPRLISPASVSCSPISAAVQALMSFTGPQGNSAEPVEIANKVDEKQMGGGEGIQPESSNKDVSGQEDHSEVVSSSEVLSVPVSTEENKFKQMPETSRQVQTTSESARETIICTRETTVISQNLQPVSTSILAAGVPSFVQPWTSPVALPVISPRSNQDSSPNQKDDILPSISSIFNPAFSELNLSLSGTFQPISSGNSVLSTNNEFNVPVSEITPTVTLNSTSTITGAVSTAQSQIFSSTSIPTTVTSSPQTQAYPITIFRTILPKPSDELLTQPSTVPVISDSALSVSSNQVSNETTSSFRSIDAAMNQIKPSQLDQVDSLVEPDSLVTSNQTAVINQISVLADDVQSLTSNPDSLTSFISNENATQDRNILSSLDEQMKQLVTSQSLVASQPQPIMIPPMIQGRDPQQLVNLAGKFQPLSIVDPTGKSQQIALVDPSMFKADGVLKVPICSLGMGLFAGPVAILPGSKLQSSKSGTDGQKPAGNLEVASALLSMGTTDKEGNKNNRIVSSFNKQRATFDIAESPNAQKGDVLFTSTGTFQIEDVEIDPKKNKIEKDSYECGKCGRVFTSLIYLARHIKRVCPDMSHRKWKCDRCDKAFRHPFGLQQHIYTHTGERPHKCELCSKAFYSANDLSRHKRTHSGERPYRCSHCGKAFSTTISLKTHTYIHTGERPHKCPSCPKTFATSSKLSRHVVTHSDKRPFSCSLCPKTFNRSGDLRRHSSKVHHQDHDLIACDDCNKVFATRQCLQNHKASHNRDHPHQERSFSADIGEESSIMTIVSPSP